VQRGVHERGGGGGGFELPAKRERFRACPARTCAVGGMSGVDVADGLRVVRVDASCGARGSRAARHWAAVDAVLRVTPASELTGGLDGNKASLAVVDALVASVSWREGAVPQTTLVGVVSFAAAWATSLAHDVSTVFERWRAAKCGEGLAPVLSVNPARSRRQASKVRRSNLGAG